MTKKNADKRAARARQARHGGKYLGHLNAVRPRFTGSGEPQASLVLRALTVKSLLLRAREVAPKEIEGAERPADGAPLVFVMADAVDPVGEALVAARVADLNGIALEVATREVRAHVRAQRAAGAGAPYSGVMTWAILRDALQRALPDESLSQLAALEERFSRPPEPDSLHVLAVGAGEMRPGAVPAVETCMCGHPIAQHDANGKCTWMGVPTGPPFIGLSRQDVELARDNGLVLVCPCGGPPTVGELVMPE